MDAQLLSVLRYVLPPLVGALIGYVTNAIAIRMLFRPLTEKRIFGVRVPLTPGIIPRQRYQLSQSIARMVSTKLLTPDALDERLQSSEFRDGLRGSISEFTDRLLNGTVDLQAREVSGELADLLGALAVGFVRSDRFAELSRELIPRATEAIGDIRLGRVLPDERRIAALVDATLQRSCSPDKRQTAAAAVIRWLDGHVAAHTTVADLVGEIDNERIDRFVGKLYDPIYGFLLRWLDREEIRIDLAERGRDLIKTILKRLNLVQRLLVSAAQYDRALNEKMPLIVDDIIASIRDAGGSTRNRRRIIAAARRRIIELTHRGVGDLAEQLRLDLPGLATTVTNAVFDLLERPDIRERVGSAVQSYVDRRSEASVQEITSELFGTDKAEFDQMILDALRGWVDAPESDNRIRTTIAELVGRHVGSRMSVSTLIRLEAGQKERLDALVTGQAVGLLQQRVPALIEGLDIHSLVVRKIDALDVESVEKLLLMVIAKHLKWINLFGAILGAMIGGIQVLLNLLN